ncbi:MAG TPA: hypothetical protein VJ801_02365 [Polyangia bacterium]|jgi:hypothetical protein|nr:hypothetical protein [Polyangia bacterium]
MPDIIPQVTKAPSVLFAFIKAHYAIMAVFVLGMFVLAMAKKDSILLALTSTDATTGKKSITLGDRLPASLRKFLTGATVALAFGASLLFSGDANAATCCAAPVAAHAFAWLGAVAPWLALLGGSLVLGLTQFSAPDVIDCEESSGGPSLSVAGVLAATTPQSLYVKTATHSTTKSGAPLVATDLTVEVACNINNLSTGDAEIEEDDLARMLSYLEITSPVMGSLTDQVSCTGPVLDLVTRFIADAFERSGDAPIASITIGDPNTNTVAVTKYFTRPFALRFMDRPLKSAPWLGLLHNTRLNIGLAADACLEDVSAGATVSGPRVLKASISYLPVPAWYYPLVAYDRVESPASGSNGLTFRNFGGPGPKCTSALDYVHTIGQLSNLKGLPGNLTFDTITQLLAPRFGLDNVVNVAHLVKARLRAQYTGHIGGLNYGESGNYVKGTLNDPGMALASLLFFLLQQPSLDMGLEQMRAMGASDELPMQYVTSAPRTGPDAFYFGAVRKVSPSVIAEWRALPSSGLPNTIESVRHFRAPR